MNADNLKEALIDILEQDPFPMAEADNLVEMLAENGLDKPFEEEELLDRDYNYDLLGYCCAFATLPGLQWVLKKQIMGHDADVSLYTASALADDLVSEDTLRFLLQSYGVSFEEVCFGDLDEHRQELVMECIPDFDAE